MAFSDLQQKVAVESGIIAAHANMAKLSLFAKSYSELASNYGNSVSVPVYALDEAAAFQAGSNDYGTGSNEVDGIIVNLDQHLVKSVSITDRELADTGIAWVKDATTSLADVLTRAVNKTVFGMINETNITKTATLASTKAGIAELVKVAYENDIPADRCVVVLNPAEFAKVLGTLDANIYGGTEAIRLGMIPNMFGFKGVVCSANLPEGVKGALIMQDAVAIVNRYLAPAMPDAYPSAFSMTDEDGFTLGARRFMDLSSGSEKYAMDVLFGAKIIQKDACVILK